MSDLAFSLLPPNATPVEIALELSSARIQAVETANAGLWIPATCPTSVLPWLAWAFSVDVWDAAWPEARKRAVIAASLDVHRRKGTRGALERALAAVGHPTQVVEWFEPGEGGAPYTFRVRVGVNEGCGADELQLIASQIQAAKNLRSWLSRLTLSASPRAAAYVGAAARARIRVRLPARAA